MLLLVGGGAGVGCRGGGRVVIKGGCGVRAEGIRRGVRAGREVHAVLVDQEGAHLAVDGALWRVGGLEEGEVFFEVVGDYAWGVRVRVGGAREAVVEDGDV